MIRTVVLNVVGLTPALLGPHTPRLEAYRQAGAMARIRPAFPAVTCTAQSDYLTGRRPAEHGIVGNGWFNRELAEVQFWKQSNHLVQGRKVWEELREQSIARKAERAAAAPPSAVWTPQAEPLRDFTVAKLFWWFNMYSTADYSITPRPIYPADGCKVFDIYSWPFSIRPEIKQDLGEFPFAAFWGPAAGVPSPQGAPDAASRWIAESAKWIERKFQPTLSLVYLPHLDYNLQRHGPFLASPARALNPAVLPDLRAIDALVGDLLDFFRERGVQVLLVSEYGLTNVGTPIHLNRLFRERGWLTVKDELGLDVLDCGASRVFAVADHQVAHVYCQDVALKHEVRSLLESLSGVDQVLGRKEKAALGLSHPRAGDYVAVAKESAWFTYYYWLDDAQAPDFARCVDIHRKPGYDPVDLFLDPKVPAVKLRILWRLLQKRLGFRTLMDVVPLDATLVKGSHGRRPASSDDWPVLIGPANVALPASPLESTEVYGVVKRAVLGREN
ncbi:MAG: alkaline phosphatase family protein [Verrucomicrobia bacterium]|nr:alkaline phosphatase family protein [Verrucomicrobiota bacterium]